MQSWLECGRESNENHAIRTSHFEETCTGRPASKRKATIALIGPNRRLGSERGARSFLERAHLGGTVI
jgi:hypothetical protein